MSIVTKPVRETKPRVVIAQDGTEVTRSSILAMRNLVRWTAKKKQRVVAAIVGGVISIDEAVEIVPFSSKEEWQQDITHFKNEGIHGLKVTKLQKPLGG